MVGRRLKGEKIRRDETMREEGGKGGRNLDSIRSS